MQRYNTGVKVACRLPCLTAIRMIKIKQWVQFCTGKLNEKVDIDPRSSQLKFGTRLKGCKKVKAAGV